MNKEEWETYSKDCPWKDVNECSVIPGNWCCPDNCGPFYHALTIAASQIPDEES